MKRVLALLLLIALAAPAAAQGFYGQGQGAPHMGWGGRGGGLSMSHGLSIPAQRGYDQYRWAPRRFRQQRPPIAEHGGSDEDRPYYPRRPRPHRLPIAEQGGYDQDRPYSRRIRPQRPPIAEQVEPRPPVHRPPRGPNVETPPPSGLALTPPQGETRFAADEVLVLMRDESDEKTLRAFGRQQNLDLVQSRQLALIGKTVQRYRIANGRDLRLTLRKAARDPRVAWIQPDYLYRLQGEAANPDSLPDASRPQPDASESAAPDTANPDAAKPDTAKLESALPAQPAQEVENAPPGLYAGRALNLQRAHKIAVGAGVRVAVIDSLIDAGHPEIDGAVADRFDTVASAGSEPQAHGTAMAGAISGHRKLNGVAPRAELLAVRAFGDRGDATRAVTLDIAAGVDWAASTGAKVVNMSFAGPRDPLLGEVLSAAAKKGLILVAAAGNEGPRAAPLYPAAYADVIAVSAVDEQARIYDKAASGPYVALAAPGVDVLVAAPRGAYDLSTGTSVACAEVSGIVALLLEKRPGLGAAALRTLLRDTAKTLSGQQGLGEADALAAVERN